MTQYWLKIFRTFAYKMDGRKQMNAKQWGFLLQSLGMHWAKAFFVFPKKPLETGGTDFSGIELPKK
jgi:hypothetical protein